MLDERAIYPQIYHVIESELWAVDFPAKEAKTIKMAQKLYRIIRNVEPLPQVTAK